MNDRAYFQILQERMRSAIFLIVGHLQTWGTETWILVAPVHNWFSERVKSALNSILTPFWHRMSQFPSSDIDARASQTCGFGFCVDFSRISLFTVGVLFE